MNKMAKILLVLLILFFPTGELLRIRVIQNVYTTPQDIISAFIFVIVVIYFIKHKIKPFYKEYLFFSLLFISFGILSLIVNSFVNPSINFFVSLLYTIRYLIYLSLFFLPSIIDDKKLINNMLFVSGAVVVILGFPQYIFYNDLANLRYLGWDNHLYRLFSTFLDPNFVGLFYVIYLAFLINRIVSKSYVKSKLPEIIVASLTLFSIFLTYSRTGFITLLVFTLVLLLILKKTKMLLLVFAILFASLFIISNPKIEGLNPFRIVSTLERVKSAQNAVTIFLENPIIGTGFNSYRYVQIQYGYREINGAAVSNADAGTDNSFLFILATTGILGFVFFILGYFYLLKRVFLQNKIYFSAIISLMAGSIFINALFYIPIITFTFLMIAFMDKEKFKVGR